MKCPYCGSDNTYVKDSRQYYSTRHRRYECQDCKKRFSTNERVIASQLKQKEEEDV